MHAIERYGLVALLFLVVTVVAVLMWDGNQKAKKPTPAPAVTSPAAARPRARETPGSDGRLVLMAKEEPGPLQRPLARMPEQTAQEGLAGAEFQPAGLRPGNGSKQGQALQAGPDVAPGGLPREAPVVAPEKGSAPSFEPLPADRPVAAVPPKVEPATHSYVVQSGDTLSEIAQHELGSARRWQEIVAANPGLDPARLRAGKTIQLPGSAAAPAQGATASRATTPADAKTPSSAARAPSGSWKVAKGENLWKIAERALGDGKRWPEIAALNPRMNPDRLALGQVLVLPAKGGTTNAVKGSAQGGTRVAGGASKSSAPLVASTAGSTARRRGKVK